MAYSIVQVADGYVNSSGAADMTATFASPVTLGNSVIAITGYFGSGVSLALNGGTNTDVPIVSEQTESGLSMGAVWVAVVTDSVDEFVLDFVGASVDFPGVVMVEVSGLDAFDAFAFDRVTNPGTGTDGISTGNTATLAAQPSMVLAVSMKDDGDEEPLSGTGYTDGGAYVDYGVGGDETWRLEHKRVTATTAVAGTFTAKGGEGTFGYGSMVLVFEETAGGAPITDGPKLVLTRSNVRLN